MAWRALACELHSAVHAWLHRLPLGRNVWRVFASGCKLARCIVRAVRRVAVAARRHSAVQRWLDHRAVQHTPTCMPAQ